MLRGGLAGVGARGGLGSIDAPEVPRAQDWHRLLRPYDVGGAFVANSTRLRWAGVSTFVPGDGTFGGFGTIGAYAGLSAVDRYFAIPEWFPRGGTIKRLAQFMQKSTLLAAGDFQLHVYSSGTVSTGTFQGYPYPAERLLSGTLFDDPAISQGVANGAVFHVYDSLTELLIDDQTLLWFVLRCNAAHLSGSKWALSRGFMPPWMGMTTGQNAGNTDATNSYAYGWSHTTTFANGADATFPQTSPVVLPCGGFAADVPAIGYGFTQS